MRLQIGGFKKFGGIDGLIKRRVGSKSLVKCQSREEALANAQKAQKVNPNNKSAHCLKSMVYLEMYKRDKEKTILQKAFSNLKECVSYNPTPRFLLLAAQMAHTLSKKQEALLFLKELVRLFPNSNEAKTILQKVNE